jgi:hypothetical protein
MVADSFSAIPAGVLGGATMANQVTERNPGTASDSDGRSGRNALRSSLPTAMAFRLPFLISGAELPRLSNSSRHGRPSRR